MIAKQQDVSSDVITISPNCVALTIAGSDPSGGAGLQADLKTFQQLGVYGMAAVTLITVQNTLGVRRLELLTPDLVVDQIRAVREDIEPLAVKTGALGSAGIVEAVSAEMATVPVPVVVDPVLVSKHGAALADESVMNAYRKSLLPHATLVTPNRFEAEKLTGLQVNSEESGIKAARALRSLGAECVLIKMGEYAGKSLHLLAMGIKSYRYGCLDWLPTTHTVRAAFYPLQSLLRLPKEMETSKRWLNLGCRKYSRRSTSTPSSGAVFIPRKFARWVTKSLPGQSPFARIVVAPVS